MKTRGWIIYWKISLSFQSLAPPGSPHLLSSALWVGQVLDLYIREKSEVINITKMSSDHFSAGCSRKYYISRCLICVRPDFLIDRKLKEFMNMMKYWAEPSLTFNWQARTCNLHYDTFQFINLLLILNLILVPSLYSLLPSSRKFEIT